MTKIEIHWYNKTKFTKTTISYLNKNKSVFLVKNFLWFLLCISEGLVSCISEDYEGPNPDLPSRTVLVYMDGDNNLYDEIEPKIEAMRQGWKYGNGKLLVYCDIAGKGARLLRIRGGCQVTPEPYIETVHEYGEINSASADVFKQVFQEAIQKYPAEEYGLIYFSHASGWLPSGALSDPSLGTRSFGSDHNTEMELDALVNALPEHKLKFIIFEACLTAGVETVYALRNKTDYLLVSSAEMLSPGFTPIYKSSIMKLFDTEISTVNNLKNFASDYYTYVSGLTGNKQSATISIIDTKNLENLAETMREINTSETTPPQTNLLQHFDRPGQYGDTPALPKYFDFQDYIQQITPEYNVYIKNLLNKIVVWKAATETFLPDIGGFNISKHSGLTIYIEQEELPTLNAAYKNTEWYRDTSAE